MVVGLDKVLALGMSGLVCQLELAGKETMANQAKGKAAIDTRIARIAELWDFDASRHEQIREDIYLFALANFESLYPIFLQQVTYCSNEDLIAGDFWLKTIERKCSKRIKV